MFTLEMFWCFNHSQWFYSVLYGEFAKNIKWGVSKLIQIFLPDMCELDLNSATQTPQMMLCFFLLFSHMYYFSLLFRWFFPTRMISILRQVMGDDWFTQPGSTTVTKAILHHAALHKAAIWQDFVQLFKKHEVLTKLKVHTQKLRR